jgi:hypothetical protein
MREMGTCWGISGSCFGSSDSHRQSRLKRRLYEGERMTKKKKETTVKEERRKEKET